MDLKKWIRSVPDYPIPGVNFRDLSPLLKYPKAFKYTVDSISEKLCPLKPDIICAVDARGFLFGAPVAVSLELPIALIRKAGKLPPSVISEEYSLEYGKAKIEMLENGLEEGQRAVVIDDLLATGGTVKAAEVMIRRLKAQPIAAAFVVELSELQGRKQLESEEIISLVQY